MTKELPERAIEDPATRQALHEYRRRSLQALSAGTGAILVASVAVGTAPHGNPHGVANFAALVGFGGGGVLLGMGVIGLLRSVRMRTVLGRGPWTERQSRYRIVARGATNGQPALVIKASDTEGEAVCSVPATVWRYRRLPQGEHGLLVAGNPQRWAVIAPPDRGVLLVAKRPWLRWWRRRLRRWALGS
jgi:hypothetical protein